MATSLHEGRLLTGRAWDANAATDAGFVRDFVLNNLAHYADEAAQVRIAWGATSATFDDQAVAFQATPDNYDLNYWYPIVSFGPFPVSLRQNGDTYRLRIKMTMGCGASSSTCDMRAVLCPAEEAFAAVAADDDYVYEVTNTSTSTTSTGSSQGTNAWSNMIYAPASLTSGWTRNVSTLTDISGNAVSVEQCLVSLTIFGRTTASVGDPVSPILYGLYAAEYVGV